MTDQEFQAIVDKKCNTRHTLLLKSSFSGLETCYCGKRLCVLSTTYTHAFYTLFYFTDLHIRPLNKINYNDEICKTYRFIEFTFNTSLFSTTIYYIRQLQRKTIIHRFFLWKFKKKKITHDNYKEKQFFTDFSHGNLKARQLTPTLFLMSLLHKT